MPRARSSSSFDKIRAAWPIESENTIELPRYSPTDQAVSSADAGRRTDPWYWINGPITGNVNRTVTSQPSSRPTSIASTRGPDASQPVSQNQFEAKPQRASRLDQRLTGLPLPGLQQVGVEASYPLFPVSCHDNLQGDRDIRTRRWQSQQRRQPAAAAAGHTYHLKCAGGVADQCRIVEATQGWDEPFELITENTAVKRRFSH